MALSTSLSAENLTNNESTDSSSSMCLELALEGERLCKSGDCRAGIAFFQAAISSGTNDLRLVYFTSCLVWVYVPTYAICLLFFSGCLYTHHRPLPHPPHNWSAPIACFSRIIGGTSSITQPNTQARTSCL